MAKTIEKLDELIAETKELRHDVETMTFHVDSTDRINYANSTDSSFSHIIPNMTRYNWVSVSAFTCNKSYYNINTPYNSFYVNNNLITLTPKNYTAITICSSLKTLLDGVGLGVWGVAFDISTGKITFTTTHVGVITFTFNSDKIISRALGFELSKVFSVSCVSDNVIDMQRTSLLYITSNIIIGDSDRTTLCAVHNTGADFTKITYINPSPKETRMRLNKSNDTPNFIILDDNMNSINFNGNQVIMSLIFWI